MYNWNKSVVADLFDDEYIVANLNNGLYYSIQGEIINLLRQLPFEAPLIKQGGNNHNNLNEVWQALLNEGLLTGDYQGQPFCQGSDGHVETDKPNKLSKYADMQDLLALDPIHDVDEAGWPSLETHESA